MIVDVSSSTDKILYFAFHIIVSKRFPLETLSSCLSISSFCFGFCQQKVESLFPEEMEQDRMSLEQFMLDGLPSLNEKIDNRVNLARSRGCVLCYVATIKEGR